MACIGQIATSVAQVFRPAHPAAEVEVAQVFRPAHPAADVEVAQVFRPAGPAAEVEVAQVFRPAGPAGETGLNSCATRAVGRAVFIRARGGDGFSLVEVLISTVLMVLVTAGVFGVMNPSHGTFSREPEVADVQQRLRVATDALYRDLAMAGAGAYFGRLAGPLNRLFAPVLPFRAGVINVDPPGTFKADEITVMYVPPTSSQTSLGQPMPDASAPLIVNVEPGCPLNDSLCGFERGMTVLIYDESGAYDTFTVTAVQGDVGSLQHNLNPLSKAYAEGTKVTQVASYTYFLNKSAFQLMRYDGGAGSDNPVVDHVVGLNFDYYGDPQPPVLRKSVSDAAGPWTTYGPTPKPPGVPSGYGWPDGENCAFTVDPAGGPLQLPRLAVLGGGAPTLVRLTRTQLTDGPWCPDASNPNRFDADLLRIRRIVVTLRVEAAIAALRGPASALFTNGGTSRSGNRWAPDQEVRFDVSSRNLNLGR